MTADDICWLYADVSEFNVTIVMWRKTGNLGGCHMHDLISFTTGGDQWFSGDDEIDGNAVNGKE